MKRFLPMLLLVFGDCLWAQSRELWASAGASILSYTAANEQLGSPSPDGNPGDVKIGNGYRFGFRFGFNSMEGARLIVCVSTTAPGKALRLTDGLKAPEGDNCRYVCPANNVTTCDIEDGLHARLGRKTEED